MGRILAQSPQSSGGMSGAGWGGERPLIRPNSANSGGRRGARENYGGLSPPNIPGASGAIFARFAGSGFAAVRVRLARPAESGVGAGREFPECPGQGARRPAPHSATGKAFFRPPVRIRAVLGRAARVILWRYISAITSGQARTPRKARHATRRPPVSTSYCTARRADGGGTALRYFFHQLRNPKASSRI